ncbi:molybdenum cofactor guanylyltransferase [Pelagibacteraceae bacterium]|nr:molybdenum cofactor guanylyltransferase [Pelagibacteraceae bacterium]
MSEDNILGAILAGGQSKRMGKDKLFLELDNKKLIGHTIDKVKKYLKKVIIITSQDNEFFSKNNLTTVKDCIEGQLGPLVGILTAMKWAKENLNKCSWIATFPCDTPFFPESIIKSFIEESEKKESLILSASSHGRKHNIFGLWSLDLYDKLKDDLINKKVRKVQDWTEKNKIKNLEFTFKDYDPFFNINTKEDLEFAKKLSKKIKNE